MQASMNLKLCRNTIDGTVNHTLICRFWTSDILGLQNAPIKGGTGLPRERLQGRLHLYLLPYFPAKTSAPPSALHWARASSSGASLQMTGSQANIAPLDLQVSVQVRIHSPSPQP